MNISNSNYASARSVLLRRSGLITLEIASSGEALLANSTKFGIAAVFSPILTSSLESRKCFNYCPIPYPLSQKLEKPEHSKC